MHCCCDAKFNGCQYMKSAEIEIKRLKKEIEDLQERFNQLNSKASQKQYDGDGKLDPSIEEIWVTNHSKV